MHARRVRNDISAEPTSVNDWSWIMADEMAAQVHPRDRQELLRVQVPRGSSPSRVAPSAAAPPSDLRAIYVLAWLLCAVFYFYQYAVRSAPGVMQPELIAAWGGNYLGGMISAYYVAYALMALVAGLLLDRYGARATIPLGIAAVGIGCSIFAQGSLAAGMVGFVLQRSVRSSDSSARPMSRPAICQDACSRF